MVETLKIETGAHAILRDASGLDAQGLSSNMLGQINSVVEIEGVEYIYFMPLGEMKSYVITSNRVEVIELTPEEQEQVSSAYQELASTPTDGE